MRDNGTLRWAREYAQGEAVAFNSLAYDNGRIYAAGSQQVVRKKALVMLLNEATGDILERRYPAYFNLDYDQEAAFVQVFNNRVSYVIRYNDPARVSMATVLVQTSLDNSTVFMTDKTGLETDPTQAYIKRTRFNDYMIMRNSNYQSNLVHYSQMGQTTWSRRLNAEFNTAEVHNGFDTLGVAGGISVGHYSNYWTGNVNRMQICRFTSKGNAGTCSGYGYTFWGDTMRLLQFNHPGKMTILSHCYTAAITKRHGIE